MQTTMLRALKNTIIYHVSMGAVTLLGYIPTRFAPFAAQALGRFAHLLARHERRLARRHLEMALDSAKTKARAKLLTRGVFLQLAKSAVEVCRLRNAPHKSPRVRFSNRSRQAFDRALAKNRGVIFVTGHIGNWELLAHVLSQEGYPVSTVAKESYDPRFTKQIDRFRQRSGVQVIYRGRPGAPAAMLRALKAGRAIGFLMDQDTRVPSAFVPFFGRPASTPVGPAELAIRTGAAVVVGTIHRTSRGAHVIDIEACPIPADVEQATAILTARLEARIRRHPTQWVWFHQRWRTKPLEKTAA